LKSALAVAERWDLKGHMLKVNCQVTLFQA